MAKHAATRQPKLLSAPRDRHKTLNRAPSPRWVANYREQITTRKLITRLQTFAIDDPDNPTGPRLTRTQAMVGLALLRKVLPDMQSLEVSGNTDQPITVQILRFADPTDTNPIVPSQNGHKPHAAQPDEPLVIDLSPEAFEARIEASPHLIEDEPKVGRSVGKRSTRQPKV